MLNKNNIAKKMRKRNNKIKIIAITAIAVVLIAIIISAITISFTKNTMLQSSKLFNFDAPNEKPKTEYNQTYVTVDELQEDDKIKIGPDLNKYLAAGDENPEAVISIFDEADNSIKVEGDAKLSWSVVSGNNVVSIRDENDYFGPLPENPVGEDWDKLSTAEQKRYNDYAANRSNPYTEAEAGLIKALNPGKATIKAVLENDNKWTNSKEATFDIIVIGVSMDSSNKKTLSVGDEATMKATIYKKDQADDIKWSIVEGKDFASIDSKTGLLKALKQGKVTVKAESKIDGSTVPYYATQEIEIKEDTVAVQSVSLNESSLTLKKGESKKLIATIEPEDATNKSVIWSTNRSSVATVDENGNVTAVAKGTAVIKVTTKDGNMSDECQVTVEEDTQNTPEETEHIKLSSTSERLSVGATLTLSAITDPEQEVVWTSSDEKIAKLVEPGCVYGVAEGTATITATTADGKYSASCKVTVVGQNSNQDNNDNNNNNNNNNDNNNNNNNNNNPNDNKNNTSINGKTDNSLSNNKLPYTGFASFLKVAMVIVILVGSSMYILYRRYNGIK